MTCVGGGGGGGGWSRLHTYQRAAPVCGVGLEWIMPVLHNPHCPHVHDDLHPESLTLKTPRRRESRDERRRHLSHILTTDPSISSLHLLLLSLRYYCHYFTIFHGCFRHRLLPPGILGSTSRLLPPPPIAVRPEINSMA